MCVQEMKSIAPPQVRLAYKANMASGTDDHGTLRCPRLGDLQCAVDPGNSPVKQTTCAGRALAHRYRTQVEGQEEGSSATRSQKGDYSLEEDHKVHVLTGGREYNLRNPYFSTSHPIGPPARRQCSSGNCSIQPVMCACPCSGRR